MRQAGNVVGELYGELEWCPGIGRDDGMIGILVAAFVAALLTMGITPWVRGWVERRGVIDQPEARRVNKNPIPRAGGIAIVLGFLVAVILTVTARQMRLPDQRIWTPQVTGVLLATTFIALAGL